MNTYFRRVPDGSQHGPFGRGSASYEVWEAESDFRTMTLPELDRLLDGRRVPADFWAAVRSADDAVASGDCDSWIESGTGRRVALPPTY